MGVGHAAWDDLAKLHVQQTARVVNATDSGGSFLARQMPDIDLQRSDTLGLARDEMAELVALDVWTFRAYVDDNDYADAENYRASLNIGINRALDGDFYQDNDLETDNLGTPDELAGRTRLDDDGGTVWRCQATYLNGSGAAGAGTPTMFGFQGNAFKNYRADFGQGPIVDPNDSFVHGAGFNGVNLGGNGNVVFVVDWTGYFDVFEVDLHVRRTN